MTRYLTILDKDLNRLVQQTPRGMAFWSGTCPDQKRTCGECSHYAEINSHRYGCELYKQQTGVGQPLLKATPACKYFDGPKPKKKKTQGPAAKILSFKLTVIRG
jgi:hypothetical protein